MRDPNKRKIYDAQTRQNPFQHNPSQNVNQTAYENAYQRAYQQAYQRRAQHYRNQHAKQHQYTKQRGTVHDQDFAKEESQFQNSYQWAQASHGQTHEEFVRAYSQRFAHILNEIPEILRKVSQDSKKRQEEFKQQHKERPQEDPFPEFTTEYIYTKASSKTKTKTYVWQAYRTQSRSDDSYQKEYRQAYQKNIQSQDPYELFQRIKQHPLVKIATTLLPPLKRLGNLLTNQMERERARLRILPKNYFLKVDYKKNYPQWATWIQNTNEQINEGRISYVQEERKLKLWTQSSIRDALLNTKKNGFLMSVTDPELNPVVILSPLSLFVINFIVINFVVINDFRIN